MATANWDRNKFLILVRHTAVSPNPNISAAEWPVSPAGRRSAIALSKKIKPFQPAAIYTSTELKAYETGVLIAAELDLEAVTVPNLHEHERRNVPYFADKAKFESKVRTFFAQPNQLVLGNETAEQARTRFQQAIDTLFGHYPTETVVVVTHGTMLSLFVKQHNPEIDLFTFWQSLALPDMVVLQRPLLNICT